jgi:DUF1680 family protein
LKTGYLSAFPEYFIDRAIQGTRVWAPWYTLHKMYQGLLDTYTITGNQQALDVVLKMCDWAYGKLKPLTPDELKRMLNEEFGGMEEAVYNIYAVTGNPKHKELAEMFRHEHFFAPLLAGEDKLAGLHANTQIPKMVGEARGYELTGNTDEEKIAKFFWQTVLQNHTYVTGGHSDSEHFGEPGKLAARLGENTTETCNTYNMLKLTRHLFTWEAAPQYADYYERALFNHILSSQNPETGGVTYYHTLHPGSAKTTSLPFDAHTCCVGTGYENHAKYGEAIYYKTADGQGLYVNLFIASELTWKEKGLTVLQVTQFPVISATQLTITAATAIRVPLHLRYPVWATNGVTLKVNGKAIKVKQAPGSYILIDRTWKTGDVITFEMPMSLHAEYMPDDANKGAFLYGPIVLAADLGTTRPEGPFGIPVLVDAPKSKLTSFLTLVSNEPLTFQTKGVGQPKDITLRPLFRFINNRYTVYLDFLTQAEWKSKQNE